MSNNGTASSRQNKHFGFTNFPFLLVAALSLIGCDKAASPSITTHTQLPTVSVAVPVNKVVQEVIEYTGRIEPSQRVEVRSRVSGYLQSIKFKDGQRVNVGDVLFIIDNRQFIAARDRAKAEVLQANARLKLASTMAERAYRLQSVSANSVEDLDRIKADHEMAQASLISAEANLRSAELELGFTTIRAPISGVISDRRVDVGSNIAGGSFEGTTLTTIVASSPVYALAELSEADYIRLRKNKIPDKVQIILDSLDKPKEGQVDFIDNEAGSNTGTIRMRAVVSNTDYAVLPGNFVRIGIPIGLPQARLLIPDSAVLSDQTRKLVFVVNSQGQVQARPVQLGSLEGEQRVVLSGLSPNDRVIISGGQKVKPGSIVQVATVSNRT